MMIDPMKFRELAEAHAAAQVINIRKGACDVYIGRARAGEPENKWGNPYPLPEGASAQERSLCLMRYLGHIQRTKLWMQVHELKDKRLGCFCAPAPCHGHILARLALDAHVGKGHDETGRALDGVVFDEAVRDCLQQLITSAVSSVLASAELEVAVSGVRTLIDRSQINERSSRRTLEAFEQDTVEVSAALDRAPWRYKRIHHGACVGADLLAEQWAITHKIPFKDHPADWQGDGVPGAYDKSAGPRRNALMLKEAEAFVALWDKESAGTKDFFTRAWQSPKWLCWAKPVQSDRVKVRIYGVRFDVLARHMGVEL